MSEQIVHNSKDLGEKIVGLDSLRDVHAQTENSLVRDFGQIGEIIDGEAIDELSQGIDAMWKMVRENSTAVLGMCGNVLNDQQFGVSNAKTARDIAGADAYSAASGWSEGSTGGGKH
ncbi:hypothetical protein [Kineosporia sp. NBRC 101731]|uniref:hypothetical protein n=1 Tax=Kineosporia sp. NBRC 101731 TaxID=3032199 RepID=UPI0024A1A993|nr:hypothetical protein [Kineosporia sp. NBRC 101731]GLY33791.1 hypothetical protein Kisp02_71560 [Kineosporia sp. NBRC 101731]